MLKTMMKRSCWFLICLISTFAFSTGEAPKVITQVNLNGVVTKTYFNDGDTFKILDGELKNTRVRIEGFNTLETYGPVHEWNSNDPYYLYALANRATDRAQQGPWNCESNGKKDTYGRLLATCDDLALALIGEGLAHAYSIDNKSADRAYIARQQTAKTKKLGIWKHGVPEYIITSLHSADEGGNLPYNRLISTVDGHTKKWSHRDNYESCEKVCVFGEASCMVYVPFEHRYGSQRPDCLR